MRITGVIPDEPSDENVKPLLAQVTPTEINRARNTKLVRSMEHDGWEPTRFEYLGPGAYQVMFVRDGVSTFKFVLVATT